MYKNMKKINKVSFTLGLIIGIIFVVLILVIKNQYSIFLKKNSWSHYLFNNRFAVFNSTEFSPSKKTIKVRFINLYGAGTKIPGAIDRILKEKYNVEYVVDESYDLVIDGPHGKTKITKENAVKFYYTLEAEMPNLAKYDLSIGFDNVDDQKYIRVPFAYIDLWDQKFHKLDINYSRAQDQGECNPREKNFACALITNYNGGDGSISRVKLFHMLSLYKEVLSGGSALNNNTYLVGNNLRIVPREETEEWLSQCKFVIAYENTENHDGYITEKPFQAYFSGAIPLYRAHSSVLNDINKDAVIFAGDFKTDEEIVEYIKRVDQDDDLYCKIWNHNIINKKEMGYQEVYDRLRTKIHEILEAKLKIN